MVENTSDWLWEIDVDGTFTYASPKVFDLLGYTPEDLIGKMNAFDLMSPEEAAKVNKEYSQYLKLKLPFQGIINVNQHKNVSEVILESSGIPLIDENGNLICKTN